METAEQMTTNLNGKISRRERKMQERWTITVNNNKNNNNEQLPAKTFLGVEFPPIAVLRRKFSSSPPPKPIPLSPRRKDNSSARIKVFEGKNEINDPSQTNIDRPNDHISSTTLNRSMPLQNQVSLL